MKHAFNYYCIVSKDTGEITVEQKRINNALMENRNAIIKLVTKAASGYPNWERFRNRCMMILEKASILKSQG
ncbi:transposase [uncultured Holdemanella sp.]|uniref:transposase n=1 Tax=uncultured Holdemanella sp. TaxID=1763549 RepID=UPI0025D4D4FD|nr:transposase [uncultured Holdemanella sp.]